MVHPGADQPPGLHATGNLLQRGHGFIRLTLKVGLTRRYALAQGAIFHGWDGQVIVFELGQLHRSVVREDLSKLLSGGGLALAALSCLRIDAEGGLLGGFGHVRALEGRFALIMPSRGGQVHPEPGAIPAALYPLADPKHLAAGQLRRRRGSRACGAPSLRR